MFNCQHQLGKNDLTDPTFLFLEHGPERLVTVHDRVETCFERFDIERTRDLHCSRKVIEGIGGIHLVHEPQSPLGMRKRQGLRPRHSGQGQFRKRILTVARAIHATRKAGKSWRIEQRSQRYVGAKGMICACNCLGREQGMST